MAFTHHHHLIFLLHLLPLLALGGGGGGCPAGDGSSLLTFKKALSDPDGHLVSWAAAVDCCLWVHVSCDATGVTNLRLASLNLSSTDMDAFAPLAGLTNLVSLDLSNNNFADFLIPAGIVPNLPRLTHLNLSMSGFKGSVPPELGTARMLVSLDLSQDMSVGAREASYCAWYDIDCRSVPPWEVQENISGLRMEDASFLADLPELEELYLDGVDLRMAFSGKNCRALSYGSPKLRIVRLQSCSIVNCSLEMLLNNLTSITHLVLHWNDFSSSPVPAFLSNFLYLSVLNLADCSLVGEFPAGVFQLKWLRILDVSFNPRLSGKLLEFPKGSSLEKLLLSDTNFTGELPASIGNLAHLTKLGIY